MKPSSFSLLRKMMLSTVPMIIGMTVSITSVVTLTSEKDLSSAKAVRIEELAGSFGQELHRSLEAVQGQIIDPAGFDGVKKLEASRGRLDEEHKQFLELTADHSQLQDMMKSLMDAETSLRHTEDELVSARVPQAFETYTKKYLPLREAQIEKHHELAKATEEVAKELLAEAQSRRVKSATWSAVTLVTCSIFGLIVIYWVILSAIKTIRGISSALNTSSSALSRAAHEVSDTSSSLSQSSSEQAASLEETAASIEEMSSMITKNSQNAKSTAAFTTQSQEKAQEGQDAVNRMVHSMEDISASNQAIMDQINESNRQMAEIVNVIQEIGVKTKVINDIVFQTKLLSFNASVEAARAGEHGKGFAVVAEEVGNLAQMSGNAAKEISEMLNGSIQKVESIVTNTKVKVEELVANGKVKVEAGVSVARQCGDLLNDIVENVSNVSSMAGEISSASQEQSQGVTEINKAITQLDQVTQKNAATSEQTARAAEELSTQSAALRTAIKQLVATIEGGNGSLSASAPKAPPRAPAAPAETPQAKVLPLNPAPKKANVAHKIEVQKMAAGGGVPDRDHDGFRDV